MRCRPPRQSLAKATCLVITDSDQAGVEDVKEQLDQILLDMKIAHRDVDLALDGADAIPSLTSFDRVILLMPSLDGLGTHLSDIMSWVSAGGSLMLAMPPDNSSYLQVIASKLGIESAGYDYVKAESIVPSEDFMLGGGERYELSDPFDSFAFGIAARDGSCVGYDRRCGRPAHLVE